MDLTPTPIRPGGRLRRVGLWVVRSAVIAGLAALLVRNFLTSPGLVKARADEQRGDYRYALMGALEHLARRQWGPEAARVAARCLSRFDFAEQAEPYYRRGWTLSTEDRHYRAYGLVRGNFRERAIAAYDEILKRDPSDVTALRTKAGVLLTLERWADLKRVGQRLSELPDRAVTVLTPRVVRAAHWTLRPVELASPPVVGYTLVGLAHHDLLELEEAVAAFDRVLELDPGLRSMPLDRNVFWGSYGEDLLEVGRAADVVRLMERALRDGVDPRLLVLQGRAHLQLSQLDEADASWKRALDLDPSIAAAWVSLGRVSLQRNRPADAVPQLLKAESLAPGSYEVAYALGQAYQRLGKTAESKLYQEKARSLRDAKGTPPAGARPSVGAATPTTTAIPPPAPTPAAEGR